MKGIRCVLAIGAFLIMAGCSVLLTGYSSKPLSATNLVVGSTTLEQAQKIYGDPGISRFGSFGTTFVYFFKTPEAVVNRGLIMKGMYKDGCIKCGQLKLSFVRRSGKPTLAGYSIFTPVLESRFREGMALINRAEFDKALPIIEETAKQNFTEAEFTIGLMYIKGEGVRQDYGLAKHWLSKAAAVGHVRAMYDLGAIYRNGEGVPVDKEAAKALYLRSAEEGYPVAAHELAKIYQEDGDLKSAQKWFERAKKAGYSMPL